jgi:hypothetical protein
MLLHWDSLLQSHSYQQALQENVQEEEGSTASALMIRYPPKWQPRQLSVTSRLKVIDNRGEGTEFVTRPFEGIQEFQHYTRRWSRDLCAW